MDIFIVDDEKAAIENLKDIIEYNFPELKIKGTANNAYEAAHFLQNNNIDILFLDIRMPNEDGFDLLGMLPQRNFYVVFVTAYDQYALKAMKASATDYLLKPVSASELGDTIQKIANDNKKQLFSQLDKEESIKHLLRHIHSEQEIKSLVLHHHRGFHIVKYSEIIYIEADQNYTHFYLTDHNLKITISRPMKDFEDILDPYLFFRIHRSFIINIDHLKEYFIDSTSYAVMSNFKKLEISRRKKDAFLEQIFKRTKAMRQK